jgi:alcohol dehydrogenase (NADP+)
MKTLEFRNNDHMPILGLGTWKSEKGEVYDAVRNAIKIGYRHIDCAPIYMNEEEIGRAFSDAFSEGDVKREDLWVTSKLWCNSHGAEYVEPALQKTLSDLQLDYLDLYLIHWPIVFKNNIILPEKGDEFICLTEVPISLTWKAMEECVARGLTKHIGVSNFSVKKLKDLIENSVIKPEINQIEIHPFLQQNGMLEFCNDEDIHLTAYSPLGSMDREDFLKNHNEPSLLEHPLILEIAMMHQSSPAQVLISWSIIRNISIIPKSTNSGRLQQNFDAQKLNLTTSDMDQISKLNKNFRYVNGTFFPFENTKYSLENLWDELI